jgi:NTE family protein
LTWAHPGDGRPTAAGSFDPAGSAAARQDADMRVGLVLGGGGVRGAAWLMGALGGLAAETGWDPAAAELVVGTSAGAVVAALTVAGARPWQALADDRVDLLRSLTDGAAFRHESGLPGLWPGSPAMLARALRAGPRQVMKAVAGALPEGFVSTAPIAGLISGRAGDWPPGRRLWIVAADFETGDRVAFGRAGSPSASLPEAVAASCAVPGFYRPVRIAGRRYVDGGVHSGANLDLVAGRALDLVLCLNPLSSPPGTATGVHWPVRALLHAQLTAQARAVERAGVRVLLLEPDGRSIGLIGLNPMSRRRTSEIGLAAATEVRAYLRRPDVAALIEGLDGPPMGGRKAVVP